MGQRTIRRIRSTATTPITVRQADSELRSAITNMQQNLTGPGVAPEMYDVDAAQKQRIQGLAHTGMVKSPVMQKSDRFDSLLDRMRLNGLGAIAGGPNVERSEVVGRVTALLPEIIEYLNKRGDRLGAMLATRELCDNYNTLTTLTKETIGTGPTAKTRLRDVGIRSMINKPPEFINGVATALDKTIELLTSIELYKSGAITKEGAKALESKCMDFLTQINQNGDVLTGLTGLVQKSIPTWAYKAIGQVRKHGGILEQIALSGIPSSEQEVISFAEKQINMMMNKPGAFKDDWGDVLTNIPNDETLGGVIGARVGLDAITNPLVGKTMSEELGQAIQLAQVAGDANEGLNVDSGVGSKAFESINNVMIGIAEGRDVKSDMDVFVNAQATAVGIDPQLAEYRTREELAARAQKITEFKTLPKTIAESYDKTISQYEKRKQDLLVQNNGQTSEQTDNIDSMIAKMKQARDSKVNEVSEMIGIATSKYDTDFEKIVGDPTAMIDEKMAKINRLIEKDVWKKRLGANEGVYKDAGLSIDDVATILANATGIKGSSDKDTGEIDKAITALAKGRSARDVRLASGMLNQLKDNQDRVERFEDDIEGYSNTTDPSKRKAALEAIKERYKGEDINSPIGRTVAVLQKSEELRESGYVVRQVRDRTSGAIRDGVFRQGSNIEVTASELDKTLNEINELPLNIEGISDRTKELVAKSVGKTGIDNLAKAAGTSIGFTYGLGRTATNEERMSIMTGDAVRRKTMKQLPEFAAGLRSLSQSAQGQPEHVYNRIKQRFIDNWSKTLRKSPEEIKWMIETPTAGVHAERTETVPKIPASINVAATGEGSGDILSLTEKYDSEQQSTSQPWSIESADDELRKMTDRFRTTKTGR